jgi:hypothetical protein
MKRILFASILSVSAIALTLNSCKKTEPDTETQSAVDNSICEGEFTSRMPVIHGFAIKENGVKAMMDARAGSCPSILINPADTLDGFPVTMTLDYGTSGCVDSIDGKIRKGQIVAKFDRKWDSAGATVTVKLVNYFVKNNATADFVQYNCDSIMIIHNSAVSFTNTIIGGKCTAPSWNLEWAGSRTLTQTAGFATPFNPYDDVYSFTGSANGKNRNGKTYTVVVKVPVVKRATCPWIESGRIEITPEGLSPRTVDYGSGTCDSQATLTINGNAFTFTMN